MDGRNLSEQIAAGEMVDILCGEPLSAALDVLGIGAEVVFSRRAAGAFHVILSGARAVEQAGRLRDLWGIAVGCYCPGLEFVHALAEGETQRAAVRKGTRELAWRRGHPAAIFPEAPPIARRDPCTGRAAIAEQAGESGEREWLDAASLRKRQVMAIPGDAPGLADKLLDDSLLPGHVWPLRLLAGERGAPGRPGFPWLPGNNYLAAIRVGVHEQAGWLDSLEAAVEHRPGEFARLFRTFSEGVENALRRAARRAGAEVLAPAAAAGEDGAAVLPARPFLLGDGEFTAIVRADLGLSFAAALLAEFERSSARALAPLKAELSYPGPSLTGCAGIAFMKAGRPLLSAARLAESLCDRARAESGRARADSDGPRPSCLAFALVGGEAAGSGAENIAFAGDASFGPGFPAYGIGPGPLPEWKALEELVALFSEEDLAIGPVRQLVSLLRLVPGDAAKQYRRWRDVVGKALPHRLDKLDTLLASFGISARDLPVLRRGGAAVSPVADALILRAVGHALPGARPATERVHG